MRHPKFVLLVAAVSTLFLASACGEPESTTDEQKTEAALPQPTVLAEEAGGACTYLNFDDINRATKQTFTIAQAGGADEVTSCVLLTTAGTLPDITFTKAKTVSDVETYRSEIEPKGAKAVKNLGNSAYSVVKKAVKGGGPVIEIGWLTDGHMYSLRFTSAAGTTMEESETIRGPLVKAVKAVGERADVDEEKD